MASTILPHLTYALEVVEGEDDYTPRHAAEALVNLGECAARASTKINFPIDTFYSVPA